MAIAIAEGPLDAVLRMWANVTLLDLSSFTWRFYRGNETQQPDALIESYEGIGSTPAYRGLSYVVIEDFPLDDYGDRLPNFSFEVRRVMQAEEVGTLSVEQAVKAVTLIPGSGEFVYDTTIQYRQQGEMRVLQFVPRGPLNPINRHVRGDQANVTVALDDMARTLPNLEWVSVVVNWFGTSLDVASCIVRPGVEYSMGGRTTPDTWGVESYTRGTAHPITQISGSPIYGGTPSDASLIRLLQNLRARGYKIMLYPMMLMDVTGKPWRGHLTGTASAVFSFFTKSEGFNAFVNHYASIARDYADAYVIGSEMRGLTKVTSSAGIYPAVNAFIALAASVKAVVGSAVKVTYAADRSEYHHTDGGWYHLDPLWASSNIDMIGIDAYFPLTDAPENSLTQVQINAGWTSGEGYDWYYTDANRTTKANLAPAYAWKNISWWWNNTHQNPNGLTTPWVPQSKKIWFTEVGFPSVDGATNQPNVFYDPTSSDSALPRFSRGQYSPQAQRNGMQSTLNQWAASNMVEHMFWWTWDARPYPAWPDRKDIWADGHAWPLGHWLQGKLGGSGLRAVVDHLLQRAGLTALQCQTSALRAPLDGLAVTQTQSVRQLLEALQQAYFFDLIESGTSMKAVVRGHESILTIDAADAVAKGDDETLTEPMERAEELDLPAQVEVISFSRARTYALSVQRAFHHHTPSQRSRTLQLPLLLTDERAQKIAQVHLAAAWQARTQLTLCLPTSYSALEPTDVVMYDNRLWRVTRVKWLENGVLECQMMAEEPALYTNATGQTVAGEGLSETGAAPRHVPATEVLYMELPALPGDGVQQPYLGIAVCGAEAGWAGAGIYRQVNGEPQLLTTIIRPAIFGAALDALPAANPHVWDEQSSILVNILGEGTLSSATTAQVLAGANAALLGEEVIQFRSAQLITHGQYRLSGLLRGRLGTAFAIGTHAEGDRFVLLNSIVRVALPTDEIGTMLSLQAVSIGALISSAPTTQMVFTGRSLECYAPAAVIGQRDASGHLTISWKRCTRLGGHWRDLVDAPLSEESESYTLEILSATNQILRQIIVSNPTYLYSSADQIADFGSVQNDVKVCVAQRSAWVGTGYLTEAVV